MKIRITMIVESEVKQDDLMPYYEAHTIKQAAFNQQAWIDEGACDLHDLLEGDVKVTVEGVE